MHLSEQILQYLVSGLTTGAVYGLVALGFTIIYNATQIINFAQGEFVMLGGMFAVFFSAGLGLPLVPTVILALVVVTLISGLLHAGAIGPAKGAGHIQLIIITVGASILLRGAAMVAWGKDTVTIKPFTDTAPITFLGASLHPQYLWVLGLTGLVVVALNHFFKRTITGKAMRASAVNSTAASLCGVPVKRLVLISFFISGFISAMAGAVLTPVTFTSFDVGVMFGLKGFSAAVLGGLGSGFGAIAGGFILGIMESLTAGLVSSGFKDAVAFLVLLFVLFFRPRGIFGGKGDGGP